YESVHPRARAGATRRAVGAMVREARRIARRIGADRRADRARASSAARVERPLLGRSSDRVDASGACGGRACGGRACGGAGPRETQKLALAFEDGGAVLQPSLRFRTRLW